MRALALLISLACVSCTVAPTQREFRVEAVNTEEESLACVIYVGDELLLNRARAPLMTPATVELDFESEKGVFQGVKVRVRAVKIDSRGRIVRGLGEGEVSPYLDDTRYLHHTDAPRQLFILRRNKVYLD